MKAHVVVNLPDEYKAVRTNLSMNAAYTYADYKKHIRHYWYTELGGKDLLEKGTCNVATTKNDSRNGQTTMAFYTNSSGGFCFRCHKCGLLGYKAKDCTTNKKDYVKFTGKSQKSMINLRILRLTLEFLGLVSASPTDGPCGAARMDGRLPWAREGPPWEAVSTSGRRTGVGAPRGPAGAESGTSRRVKI